MRILIVEFVRERVLNWNTFSDWMYKKDWKGWSIEQQFIEEVDTYIHWYNEKWIKMSLEGKNPLEFRKESFNLDAT